MSMLEDILYPNEKDLLSTKYRLALTRIGHVSNNAAARTKTELLGAMKLSGFAKEELHELNWNFSAQLWENSKNELFVG